jgi:hypothetical protein
MKKNKKSEKKSLIKKLDEIVREIVLLRDGGCVCPPPANGHSVVFQSGHLFSRTKMTMRWSLYNCNCQCSSCNFLHEHNPHRYTRWFLQKHGQAVYDILVEQAETTYNYKVYELQEMYEQLQLILKTLRLNPYWKPYFHQADIMSGAWMNALANEMKLPEGVKLSRNSREQEKAI